MFISSTVHPPIHQNTLEFLELSDYILQYIAQIHVPCLPPHPQKDDCWWSFRSPNYPLLTSWEWPGLAKEELQKMEDRARRGEKETVRKPLEWLDPLFSGKILLLRKNQECGSFHWGWFWRWCVWLWFDDLMFRWDFSSLRCTWDVIKPWDIHHTPLHRGPAEAVCSTFGGFEDLSKGSHRESGIGGWKMGVCFASFGGLKTFETACPELCRCSSRKQQRSFRLFKRQLQRPWKSFWSWMTLNQAPLLSRPQMPKVLSWWVWRCQIWGP